MPSFDVAFLFSQFLNGLTIGMIYMLTASGLTMLLGVLGVLNFAHGSFYMLGAFMLFTFTQLGFSGWFWVGLLLIPICCGLVGGILESALLRPLYERERFHTLLLTFGLAMVFDDLVLMVWGRGFKTAPMPWPFEGTIYFGAFGFPQYYILIILIGPVVCGGLWYLLHRTDFGKLIRAASSDPETMGALGINVKWVFTGVFALGALLAGLAGMLVAPIRSIVPGMGLEVFLESFIVIVIGGLGNLRGAILGAFLIGQLKAFGILIFPNYAMVLTFALMLLVLVVRPKGLFGEYAH
jgi:branched-subunit amino acid ABC-type transport system permease component